MKGGGGVGAFSFGYSIPARDSTSLPLPSYLQSAPFGRVLSGSRARLPNRFPQRHELGVELFDLVVQAMM